MLLCACGSARPLLSYNYGQDYPTTDRTNGRLKKAQGDFAGTVFAAAGSPAGVIRQTIRHLRQKELPLSAGFQARSLLLSRAMFWHWPGAKVSPEDFRTAETRPRGHRRQFKMAAPTGQFVRN